MFGTGYFKTYETYCNLEDNLIIQHYYFDTFSDIVKIYIITVVSKILKC